MNPGRGDSLEHPAPAGWRHAVLVLPSTGAFDSRTYRIATTLIARGHRVTVIARLQPGVEPEEDHPAGYRIIRVRVNAADGLPFRALLTVVRQVLNAVVPGRRAARRAARAARGSGAGAAPYRTNPAPVGQAAGGQAAVAVPARASHSEASDDTGDPPAPPAPLLRRAYKALVRRFAIPLTIRAHIRAAEAVAPTADLYHGMAYMGIPVALALGRRHRAPVVYDARDIYLEARNMGRSRGIVRWAYATAERRWARRASRVITVNEDYADQLRRRLRIRRPLVVMNCSARFDPPRPPERRFHDLLGLDPAAVVVLYHGGLFPERGIEQLMAAIRDVPGAVLVLMGYGVLEDDLRARTAEPRYAGRVHVVDPVPPDSLHAWVAAADIVAMPIQGTTLNHRLTTPNKLFEAMAAGVPVVATNLPGMARIVRATSCGVLCGEGTPAEIVRALRQLVDDPAARLAMGRRALEAAHGTYSWEEQADRLLEAYGQLTGQRW